VLHRCGTRHLPNSPSAALIPSMAVNVGPRGRSIYNTRAKASIQTESPGATLSDKVNDLVGGRVY
jgi:hypothetical protein